MSARREGISGWQALAVIAVCTIVMTAALIVAPA
jgi:hypothetical protein